MSDVIAEGRSSSLVDRRLYKRYPKGINAELSVGERELACRITDLSLGGALVVAEGPGWDNPPVGEGTATLRTFAIGDGEPIAGRLVMSDNHCAQLAFRHGPDSEFELNRFLVDRPAPFSL